MSESFNEILSRLRREKGVSQRQAAAALGVSQALLSHYEKGVREPGLPFLSQACEYYGVSADYILGRSAYRRKMDFNAEEASAADPFLEAIMSLARAALAFENDEDRRHIESLISAMLYSFSESDLQHGHIHPELLNALATLRRTQLRNALAGSGFTLPDALRRLTEEELAMLYNK